jgi:hypothetical protein
MRRGPAKALRHSPTIRVYGEDIPTEGIEHHAPRNLCTDSRKRVEERLEFIVREIGEKPEGILPSALSNSCSNRFELFRLPTAEAARLKAGGERSRSGSCYIRQ